MGDTTLQGSAVPFVQPSGMVQVDLVDDRCGAQMRHLSRRKEPAIPKDLLEQLLTSTDAAAALSQGGLLDTLKKALAERALNAEMDHHFEQEAQGNNSRNGYSRKTVTTETGRIEIEVPRDRAGRFDPQLIAKYQRRFPGFDDKIISMYTRGMSTREPKVSAEQQDRGAPT